MADHFLARIVARDETCVTVEVGFGASASNTEIVPDAIEAIRALQLTGGRGIRFTGRASLPVAMALAHEVAHLYGYVACRDPKLGGYVVAISHLRGKPGREGSPHAAKGAAPPARGISKRSAEIPLARSPARRN